MPSSQPTEQEICQRLGQIQIEISRLIEERLALRTQLDPSRLEALHRGGEPKGVAYLGPEH